MYSKQFEEDEKMEVEELLEIDEGEEVQEANCYIDDPIKFLDFCQKDKKIKIMDECNPILNYVYLKDISLHKKGPLQDKIYSKVDRYYKNIRRGNTLCEIYPSKDSQKNQKPQLFFCRRGMKKFYDLEPQYLRVGAHLPTFHKLMRKRIFSQLDEVVEKGQHQIHLYCVFKQNGEHCQIGYVKQLEHWLFASKNVAILAKSAADLQHYQKERFYWAKLVAFQFFQILSTFTEQQTHSFIEDIDGYTLLGQHCGSDNHQHITRYDRPQIIFYGLVRNIGHRHCEPVEKCANFLNKYHLKMSFSKKFKGFTDKNTIYQCLYKLMKEIAEGTMDQKGEGSVLYIVSEKDEIQETIGMCKLKTAEYLIFRKMREMLKINIAKKGLTANSFEKFKFQIHNLVEHYFKPPKQLIYYFDLAEIAFKEVSTKENQITETYLRYKFVEFMKKIQEGDKEQINYSYQLPHRILLICLPRFSNAVEKYCKKHNICVDYTFRTTGPNSIANQKLTKHTLHILHSVPRLADIDLKNTSIVIVHYTEAQVSGIVAELIKCEDFTKSHLITFVKSEDKLKSIQILSEKILNFQISCDKNEIKITKCQSQEKQTQIIQALEQIWKSSTTVQQDQNIKGPLIKFVILPLLIPGSGKSTLFANIKKIICNPESEFNKYKLSVIDSDEIRRQIMETKGQINLEENSSNLIFQQTKQEAIDAYRQNYLWKELQKQPLEKHEILFIDRVFLPTTLQQNIQEIYSKSKPYIKIIILTQKVNPITLLDESYPYSIRYLLVCLNRCLEREDHKTMMKDPYQISKIIFKFYRMLHNFNEKRFLTNLEKSNIKPPCIIHLPFVSENQEEVNIHLKKKVEECLKMVEPGCDAKDSNIFVELIEFSQKFKNYLLESDQIDSLYLANKLLQKIDKLEF